MTVTGIAEIRARLTPEAFRTTLVEALTAALQPIVAGTSALAPRQSGKLAGGIRARVSHRGNVIMAAITAGVRYGHLVEYGHRMVTGGRVPRAGVFTPLSFMGRFRGKVVGAVPAHPFARPAFAAQQGTAAQTLERRLAAAITGPT